MVDAKGTHRIDCGTTKVDWAKRLVADVVDGSDTFVSAEHVRAVSDLTLRAQEAADPWAAAPGTAEPVETGTGTEAVAS